MLCPCLFCNRGRSWLGDGERLMGGCGEVEREVFPDAFWDCCSLLSLKKRRAGSAGEEICNATLAQSYAAARSTHRSRTRVRCVYMRHGAPAPSLDPQLLQLLLDNPLFDPIPSGLEAASVLKRNLASNTGYISKAVQTGRSGNSSGCLKPCSFVGEQVLLLLRSHCNVLTRLRARKLLDVH